MISNRRALDRRGGAAAPRRGRRPGNALLAPSLLAALLLPLGTGAVFAEDGVEVVSSTAEEVLVRVRTPMPEIREDVSVPGDEVSVPGWISTQTPGAPEVPMRGTLIGIPPNSRPRLEVSVLETAVIPSVVPRPVVRDEIREVEGGLPGQIERRERDPEVYRESYPQSWAVLGEVGGLRHLAVVPVEIYPYRWDPEVGGLRVATEMEIRIRFEPETPAKLRGGTGELTRPLREHPSWESTYQKNVLNWDQARSFLRSPTLPVRARARRALGGAPEFRIAVDRTDIYRIRYEDLEQAGWDLGAVPAEQLALEERYFEEDNPDNPFQTVPVAILVRDLDGDGLFGTGDDFIFYGLTYWDRMHPEPRDKRYGREQSYWLTVRGEGGRRMDVAPSFLDREDLTPEVESLWTERLEDTGLYMDSHADNESYTPLRNGVLNIKREHFYWFGKDIGDYDESFDLPGLRRATELEVVFEGMTSPPSGGPSRPTVAVGKSLDALIRLEGTPTVPEKYEVVATYGEEALQTADLAEKNNVFELGLPTDGAGAAVDWMQWTYLRGFGATDDRCSWRTNDLTGPREYQITGFHGTDLFFFDLTDPIAPVSLSIAPGQLSTQAGRTTVRTQFDLGASAPQRTFQMLRLGQMASPATIERASDVDLSEVRDTDLIIITHPDFREGIQPLVDRRRANGWTVEVATTREVYDQFNGGRAWPTAIRNYLRYLFRSRDVDPSFLLLVGDASEDFQGEIENSDENFVPTQTLFSYAYQLPQGTELIATDAWFVDNLTGSGELLDFLPDMHVGRLPAGDETELDNMVQKILNYENFRDADQWRNRCLLMSDDEWSNRIGFDNSAYQWYGDLNRNDPRSGESIFRWSARQSRKIIHDQAGFTDFEVDTFFVATYMDTVVCLERCVRPDSVHCGEGDADCNDWYCESWKCETDSVSGEVLDFRREATSWSRQEDYSRDSGLPGKLRAKMNRGDLFVAFQAHANRGLATHEDVWVDRPFFRNDSQFLDNVDKPFIFLGFGCHMNQFAYVIEGDRRRGDCLGERMLFLDNGRGAVAACASTAYEWLSFNHLLNLALLRSWFLTPQVDDAGHSRWLLGDLIDGGKFNLLAQSAAEGNAAISATYVLLGDPSMTVDIAPPRFNEVQVNGEEWTDGASLVSDSETDSATIEVKMSDEVWIQGVSIFGEDGKIDPSAYSLVEDPAAPGDDRKTVLSYRAPLDVPQQDYSVVIRASDRVGRERVVELPVRLGVTWEVEEDGRFQPLESEDFVQGRDSLRVTVSSPIFRESGDFQIWLDDRALPGVRVFPQDAGATRSRGWTLLAELPLVVPQGERSLELRVTRSDGETAARSLSVIGGTTGPIAILELYNFPNPFERETDFHYTVNGSARSAKISIFTLSGRKIQVLDGTARVGENVVPWDGRDRDGDQIANGLYFYKLDVTSIDGRKLSKIERVARIR